eukprot:1161777-Pelagomonas_calceolata.AAC.3
MQQILGRWRVIVRVYVSVTLFVLTFHSGGCSPVDPVSEFTRAASKALNQSSLEVDSMDMPTDVFTNIPSAQ